jgi:hypothetical protein
LRHLFADFARLEESVRERISSLATTQALDQHGRGNHRWPEAIPRSLPPLLGFDATDGKLRPNRRGRRLKKRGSPSLSAEFAERMILPLRLLPPWAYPLR